LLLVLHQPTASLLLHVKVQLLEKSAIFLLPPQPQKKTRLEAPSPEGLEEAVVAFARCSSAKEIKKLVGGTVELRRAWLKSLEDGNALQIREKFMKKFPCFVRDVSLLSLRQVQYGNRS
jgi:hypothetical protein